MWSSVDLFSGIGGFALALQGICRPLLYCDNSARANHVLESAMERGLLPSAPIVTDVRQLDEIIRAVNKRVVDVVTASWPCVGFSNRGYMRGLADERSALFHAVVQVIRALNPRVTIFENVPGILSSNEGEDLHVISKIMYDMGYDIRWTVMAASDVGAPQIRARWFCLCSKRGARHPSLPTRLDDGSRTWSRTRMPSPVVRWQDITPQLFLLGNAIVPQVARQAMYRLYSGFQGGRAYQRTCAVSDTEKATTIRVPKHAWISQEGRVLPCVAPDTKLPSESIVLSPNQFRTNLDYVENGARPVRSQLITEARLLRFWPTPRTGAVTHSHNLSERTKFDLSTVAMYASEVNGKALAQTSDRDRISLRFVEWLMGFPKGYLHS